MAVQAIRHTGIVVSDMARSLAFYRDLLGLKVWADFKEDGELMDALTDVEGVHLWMVKLKAADGGSIELLQFLSHPADVPPARPTYDLGCNHVALQVDDLDALHEKLRQHGIRFHCPPTVSTDGSAKVTYCRDPEGVSVELVELLDTKETS